MPKALVTGAGIRIGRAIALGLADAGFDLVLTAHRSDQGLEETAQIARGKGRRVHTVIADLSDQAGVSAVAKSAGDSLDVLVNSAAIIALAPFASITRAQFRELLAVNVEAAFFLTQALLNALGASASASVVNIVDAALHTPYGAKQNFAHYLASKGALSGLTLALARELAPRIRVNAVAPGPVAFGLHDTVDHQTSVLARLPLARAGEPEDVAQAVVYLASAPYVTGQVLRVDGGLSIS